ncbi:iron transporter [Hoeflea sp. AS60]|uniref:iron transporter n=1 Tax=Hoeflea sp. AS60 TaxID=3135780 RepID=UPI003173075B
MQAKANTNPLTASDEGDRKGLELGLAQGDALTRTLKHMTDEIAHDGGEVQVGEYLVAYAVEEAEGMYEPGPDGKLVWKEPDEENAHVEIAVRDAADGRLIPSLKIEATLTAPDGSDVGTHELPLLWHPYLYHYGRNWKVPGDGTYKLHVKFAAPTFMRHDKKNGNRFADGCEVTFANVKIKTGQD